MSPEPPLTLGWNFNFDSTIPLSWELVIIILVCSIQKEKKRKKQSCRHNKETIYHAILSRCQKPTPIRCLHFSGCINSLQRSPIDNYSYLQTSPVTRKQIRGEGEKRALAGRGQWEDFYISSGTRWEMGVPPSDSLRPLGEIWKGW